MTRQTLVEAYQAVEKEGFVELGEGLSLQTFKSIKNEDWFGGESDNLDWSGCEDEDIFLMTDTGDAIRVDSVAELLEEVEHDDEPVQIYRIWAIKGIDASDEQTFDTREEAIAEAERLWKYERYDNVHVSSEELLDEDGFPSDHNIIWECGNFDMEKWVDGKAVEEE